RPHRARLCKGPQVRHRRQVSCRQRRRVRSEQKRTDRLSRERLKTHLHTLRHRCSATAKSSTAEDTDLNTEGRTATPLALLRRLRVSIREAYDPAGLQPIAETREPRRPEQRGGATRDREPGARWKRSSYEEVLSHDDVGPFARAVCWLESRKRSKCRPNAANHAHR